MLKSLGSSGAVISVLQPYSSTSSGTCDSTAVIPQKKTVNAPSATFSAVRSPGLQLCYVKWSDVAAFGSKAFQPRATEEILEVAMPYNILVTIMRHEDILDALMLNCPDFPTLFALIASCKTATRAFERYSQGIVKAMLKRTPQQLRYLTVALIGIKDRKLKIRGRSKPSWRPG